MVLIFVNPIAGRGRAAALAERLSRALSARGIDPQIFTQPAYQISDSELRFAQPPQAMIVIGGDGTLRAAVERMLAAARGDGSRMPPVLLVPFGTANLMARHLHLHWGENSFEDDVLSALEARRMTHMDVGKVNDRLFLLMVGIGIDAAIVHELDNLRQGPIDLTSYAVPSVLAIQKYEYPPLTIEIDGRRVLDSEPAMALVGNIPEYGTGFPILTRARADDGELDICVLPCRSRLQVLRLLMAAATGDHLKEEGVIYARGHHVRVECPVPAPVQIDGEASGHTPVEVKLLPTRVPFIVQ